MKFSFIQTSTSSFIPVHSFKPVTVRTWHHLHVMNSLIQSVQWSHKTSHNLWRNRIHIFDNNQRRSKVERYSVWFSLVLCLINHYRLFNSKLYIYHHHPSSPPAGLQGYILCPHIVAVRKFELVVLLLHGHMWGSIGVHHLWTRPCFSSSVPRVWFVYIYI